MDAPYFFLLRKNIILKSLRHVPFDGWSFQALEAGGREMDTIPLETQRLFKEDINFALTILFQMIQESSLQSAFQKNLSSQTSLKKKIHLLLMERLLFWQPHQKALHRILGYLSLPHNTVFSQKYAWKAAHSMWAATKDSATDFNWYTKRASLSFIYQHSLIFILKENDPEKISDFVEDNLQQLINIHFKKKEILQQLNHRSLFKNLKKKILHFP